PVEVLGGTLAVPAHHRAPRGHHEDPVDAQLGELLHDQLGAVALDRGEPDRHLVGRWLGPARLAHRIEGRVAGELAHRPPTRAVGRAHPLPRAQSQHLRQVVQVRRLELGCSEVGDDHLRRGVTVLGHRAAQLRKAVLKREKNPSSGGATSSPRTIAYWRSRSSDSSSREVGMSTVTRTCRSPRPRPSRRGTPRCFSLNTWPLWVPRGITRSSTPSRVSNGRCAPSAAWAIEMCRSWTRSSPWRSKRGWGLTRSRT